MKRILIAFLLIILFRISPYAANTEKLNYIVTYKWGLIQKDAGDVEIIKKPINEGYELKLMAKTRPWADRIYKLRDTLVSVTKNEKYNPITYTYIAHEKNRYARDEIKFTYTDRSVKGTAKKHRRGKNGDQWEKTQELEGTSPVYDMLSVYFFVRDIDYEKLKPGETVNATIFSGDKVEQLTVKCEGKEIVKLRDKSEHEAWHIIFNFTSGGGKKSSDDINCWISTTSPHIPLLIIGNLPIGQVRVNYQFQ